MFLFYIRASPLFSPNPSLPSPSLLPAASPLPPYWQIFSGVEFCVFTLAALLQLDDYH
jgi:hypothetical protein